MFETRLMFAIHAGRPINALEKPDHFLRDQIILMKCMLNNESFLGLPEWTLCHRFLRKVIQALAEIDDIRYIYLCLL